MDKKDRKVSKAIFFVRWRWAISCLVLVPMLLLPPDELTRGEVMDGLWCP